LIFFNLIFVVAPRSPDRAFYHEINIQLLLTFLDVDISNVLIMSTQLQKEHKDSCIYEY